MTKIFKRWTNEEIELLKNNSQEDYETLKSLFPDRTLKSIKHKISNMKLPRKVFYERYSKEEDEILKRNSDLTLRELSELLKKRDIASIQQRLNYLDLEWNKTWEFWTNEEIEVINKFDSIKEMSKHLQNRTESQIYQKANSLGKKFNDYWTDDEIVILKQNYGEKNVSEFIHLLPNRDEKAIYIKANRLNLKGKMDKYDISDEIIIDLLNQGFYCTEIARELSMPLNTVIYRLKRNSIKYEWKIFSGEEHHLWTGTRPKSTRIRNSKKYVLWRNAIFERDNYTCQCCGDDSGGNLQAHHIENFSDHEDLRFDVNNGITLCKKCHSPSIKGSFHHTFGTRKNNQEQLDDYLLNYKTYQSGNDLKSNTVNNHG